MREVIDLSREYLGRVYLAVAKRIWCRLPATWYRRSPVVAYGTHINAVVRRFEPRRQNHSTFFFRNRPELTLMARFLERFSQGARLELAVLGCSKGAEVYSIAWTIRTARPDIKLTLNAVDISQDVLDFAREGIYSIATGDVLRADDHEAFEEDTASSNSRGDQRVSIFERMTKCEMEAMFDICDGRASVKPWLKEGIVWRRANVNDPRLARALGPQDIVVANRFLCHMPPVAAERCLRRIARLVGPHGHLFVSGVDLDLRTKVAQEMRWIPVPDLAREIHEGDPSLLDGWPLGYWALEPFRAERGDSDLRYTSVFQLGVHACVAAVSLVNQGSLQLVVPLGLDLF
jgi:chemotaxis methyl-accepting protein methylase